MCNNKGEEGKSTNGKKTNMLCMEEQTKDNDMKVTIPLRRNVMIKNNITKVKHQQKAWPRLAMPPQSSQQWGQGKEKHL